MIYVVNLDKSSVTEYLGLLDKLRKFYGGNEAFELTKEMLHILADLNQDYEGFKIIEVDRKVKIEDTKNKYGKLKTNLGVFPENRKNEFSWSFVYLSDPLSESSSIEVFGFSPEESLYTKGVKDYDLVVYEDREKMLEGFSNFLNEIPRTRLENLKTKVKMLKENPGILKPENLSKEEILFLKENGIL